MTAEKLHDALTLLSADLVAETDKKRSQRQKTLPWKRYAARAACFALVLGSGLLCMGLFGGLGRTTETAAAPEEAAIIQEMDRSSSTAVMEGVQSGEEEVLADTAMGSAVHTGISRIQYVATPFNANTTACFTGDPRITLLSSAADWEAYSSDETPQRLLLDDLEPIMERYDETWFDDHDLLLIALCNVSGCEITTVQEQEGIWEICIANDPTMEDTLSDWHIVLEVEKGLISAEDAVMLIFE